MQASLLEILREIPDRRRAEGKRFDLATVLLYSILAMVAGANSYRQMHEFIRIHHQHLNTAFGCQRRRVIAAVGRSESAAGMQAKRPPISGAFLLVAFSLSLGAWWWRVRDGRLDLCLA